MTLIRNINFKPRKDELTVPIKMDSEFNFINEIPPQMMAKIKLRMIVLRTKYPAWKPERLAKKIKQEFHIEVVDNGNTSNGHSKANS